MKKAKNLLILTLATSSIFAMASCDGNSSEGGSKDSSDSSLVATKFTITFDYGGLQDNVSISVEEGETIKLSDYSYWGFKYDCLSWNDGTNTYGPNDTIEVKANLNLVGKFALLQGTFSLSEDGTYYTFLKLSDSTATEFSMPTVYHGVPVKGIAANALKSATKLTKVDLGDDLLAIPQGLLEGLSIEELTLPYLGEDVEDTTNTIGYIFGGSLEQTYYVPTTLKKVTITAQENIPEKAFSDLKQIEEVTLEKATVLNKHAFANNAALTTLNLNEGLKEMCEEAISGAHALTSITLPSTLEIYNNGISSCDVTSLAFPKGLKEYSSRNELQKLESITIEDGNEYYASYDGILFNKDKTKIVTFPAKKAVETYTIPDTVTTVGENAFMYANITSVNLNNVTRIETEGFRYAKLESVTFPSALTYIGQTAFSGESKLTTVNFAETLTGAEKMTLGGFVFSSCEALTALDVPAYITSLPKYFVSGDKALASLTIKGNIESIGEYAFTGLTSLKSLETTFADNATIGEYPFNNSTLLTTWSVHFADGVTNYPTLAEKGFGSVVPAILCDSKEIMTTLKEKWSSVATNIMVNPETYFVTDENGKLTSFIGNEEDFENHTVTLPEGITDIAPRVFYGKTWIKHLVLPTTLRKIGKNAFASNANLIDIEFTQDFTETTTDEEGNETKTSLLSFYEVNSGEEKVIKIDAANLASSSTFFIAKDAAALKDLKALSTSMTMRDRMHAKGELKITDERVTSLDGTELYKDFTDHSDGYSLPDGVTKIHAHCFENDEHLTSIDLAGVTEIGDYAFSSTAIEELVIPESVTVIGDDSFESIEALLSVKIEGAASIGSYAFASDEYIMTFDLGTKLVSIGDDAFSDSFQSNDNDGLLAEMVVPASVTEIAEAAFEGAYIDTVKLMFTQEYAEETFENGTNFLEYGDSLGDGGFVWAAEE